jgi:dihydrofolate synthase/folylpolyglutamate synthase
LHIEQAAGTIPPFFTEHDMTKAQIEQNYQAALDYLYSFVDYSMTRALRYSAEKFDLGRMVRLMDVLGNPHRAYPVIHIAGTKGKGSTAALCANALKCAGLRVGLYTSPHLEDYCERIRVNGVPISHQELSGMVEYIKPFVAKIPKLTTFEITTAIGFLHFSRVKVDVLVAEVGLGGRLDATNVVTPIVSVITSLSLDHMNVLGKTLPEIAGEKCGIIKPGIPVISSPQKPEAMQVIKETCSRLGSELIIVGRDIKYDAGRHTLDGQTLFIWKKGDASRQCALSEDVTREAFQIPLLGSHQMENAATAYAVLRVCDKKGIPVSRAAISDGFRTVDWPGRFELLSTDPLLIVDSAHNLDSARRLKQTLDEYLPNSKVRLIFGVSEDKDFSGMLAELLPGIEKVYATKSEHPRALDPKLIARQAHKLKIPAVVCNKVEEALTEAGNDPGKKIVILATGSIFIAAAIRMIHRKNKRMNTNEK